MTSRFTGSCLATLATAAFAWPAVSAQPLQFVMRDKLSHTQQLLEAIVTADFPAVDRHAEQLSRISQTEIASWQANPRVDYVDQAVVFLSSVQGLRDAASRQDADLALQEYTALVSSCVRCHQLPSVARVRLEWPAAAPAAPAGQPAIAAERAVFPVRIAAGEDAAPAGVCVAIAQEPHGGGHLVYFLTSARLVGSSADWVAEIAIGADTLRVPRTEALVDPQGRVAILRAISTRPIETAPLFLEHVPPESGVVVAGVRPDGTSGLGAARLHRQAPGSLVTLDAPGEMRLDAGAPVFIDRGLLAIASAKAPGARVDVEELAASRAFLLEQVPGIASSPPAAALFATEDREFAGPTLDVPIGRTTHGEIDVPLDLGARETILGATARLVSRTPLNLGEVTVIARSARSVRLRFAIGGDPPPALAAPWPPGQALIVLRVTLIASPSR